MKFHNNITICVFPRKLMIRFPQNLHLFREIVKNNKITLFIISAENIFKNQFVFFSFFGYCNQSFFTFNILPISFSPKLSLLVINFSFLALIHPLYFYLNIEASSCSMVKMLKRHYLTIIYRQPTETWIF